MAEIFMKHIEKIVKSSGKDRIEAIKEIYEFFDTHYELHKDRFYRALEFKQMMPIEDYKKLVSEWKISRGKK